MYKFGNKLGAETKLLRHILYKFNIYDNNCLCQICKSGFVKFCCNICGKHFKEEELVFKHIKKHNLLKYYCLIFQHYKYLNKRRGSNKQCTCGYENRDTVKFIKHLYIEHS